MVDGKFVGIGRIKSAVFNHHDEDHYGFYFDHDGFGDYYDDRAKSLRKAFLKAPLKFGRISSSYSLRRYIRCRSATKLICEQTMPLRMVLRFWQLEMER